MIGIILSGHGNFGLGIKEAVTLIAGENENVKVVDFLQGESLLELENKFREVYQEFSELQGILVFTDVIGGTPFKTAVNVSWDSEIKVKVIGGTNVAMVLSALDGLDKVDDVEDLVHDVLPIGRNQINVYTPQTIEENQGEGI